MKLAASRKSSGRLFIPSAPRIKVGSILDIQTPAVFEPLLYPARYKGAFGGRGAAKSHFFAETLVEKAIMQDALHWVCVREVQKDLKHSAKALIESKIEKFRVGNKFRVLDKHIETPGGGVIIFQGMQNHTADSVKSLEGFDGVWWEEAHSASKRSLRILRPTLRKASSELWFSWNPESPEDPVDQLFRGPEAIPAMTPGRDPTRSAIAVEANYRDNPWFPAELESERQLDEERGADDYDHVWDGGYLTISEAIIFSKRTTVARFETPRDARFFFGADWGFASDPTVLIRSFIDEATRTLYIDHEAFGHGVELDEIPQLFDSIPGSRDWPIKADCARPETISHVKSKGFSRISGAEKWDGSVEDGIAHLKGFRHIVIHERCPQMAREARLYSYKVDKQTGDVLPIVVDKHNHGWDSVRYSLDGYIKRRNVAMTSDYWRERAAAAEAIGRNRGR